MSRRKIDYAKMKRTDIAKHERALVEFNVVEHQQPVTGTRRPTDRTAWQERKAFLATIRRGTAAQ